MVSFNNQLVLMVVLTFLIRVVHVEGLTMEGSGSTVEGPGLTVVCRVIVPTLYTSIALLKSIFGE